MKGGKSGSPVEAGNPGESLLVQRINGEGGRRMPPGQNPLGEGAIARITQWVKDGAPRSTRASTPRPR